MAGKVELFCSDCLGTLPTLESESVSLVFVDPPYNIGVFCKMPPDEYLDWCKKWIAECSRILAPSGAFWVSHKDPEVLVDISREIARFGRKRINWVTWDKYNSANELQGFLDGYTVIGGLRSFQVMAEYLVYHADEGDWTAQCDRERGFIFEPLRAYLAGEWRRAGFKYEQANKACGTANMADRHFFSRSQWCLPTKEHYQSLRVYANTYGDHGNEFLRREYEDLHQEYEGLRQEYEDLRYTFNNPGKVSSVWQIPPAAKSPHPTPKPEALLERIIETTSNEGDLILDPMMGSGTTGVACMNTGRRFIGIEILQDYFILAKQRIDAVQQELVQGRFL